MFDRLANRSRYDTSRVAQIGESLPVQNTLGRVTMPLTIGTRFIATVAVIALLVASNRFRYEEVITPIPPEQFWLYYIAISALAAWYLGYIWTYALVVDQTQLAVPTWGLRAREYDLSKLIRIEDDGAYILRLYFLEGGKAEILKHVRGRAHFIEMLQSYAPMRTP